MRPHVSVCFRRGDTCLPRLARGRGRDKSRPYIHAPPPGRRTGDDMTTPTQTDTRPIVRRHLWARRIWIILLGVIAIIVALYYAGAFAVRPPVAIVTASQDPYSYPL